MKSLLLDTMPKVFRLSIDQPTPTDYPVRLDIYSSVGTLTGSYCARLDYDRISALQENYNRWRHGYLELEDLLQTLALTEIPGQVIHISYQEKEQRFNSCRLTLKQIEQELNALLNSSGFNILTRKIYAELSGAEETARVILQIMPAELRRLPWYSWSLLSDYPNIELTLGYPEFRQTGKHLKKQPGKVRILAILSDEIDTQEFEKILESTADAKAEIVSVSAPSLATLHEYLWDHDWDMLFFSGHSSSDAQITQGTFQVSSHQKYSITELKQGLNRAIANGLQLAIFCSCDGLGLAHQLGSGEELYLPQVLVMRERIPIKVAPVFLKHFLQSYTAGKSLHLSVRMARERMSYLDQEFPCSATLPILCQNPAAPEPTWQDLLQGSQKLPHRQSNLITLVGSIILVVLATWGVRESGLEIVERAELAVYDHFQRLGPSEPMDPRLLLVTIEENDIDPGVRNYPSTLSDERLGELLTLLIEEYQPRLVGLDLYRDFPVHSEAKALQNLLGNERLFVVCGGARWDRSGELIKSETAPPPEVPLNRIGFADVVQDVDGVVRRHLWLAQVYQSDSKCKTDYSLSTLLAIAYLYYEGIELTFKDEIPYLGEVALTPLTQPSAAYRQLDDRGYQGLLDYRMPLPAPTISAGQVLRGEIDPTLYTDRIILVGTTGSPPDIFDTPYRSTILGVELHAHMTSQLLSSVLDDRPLLRVWPQWAEWLWLMVWTAVSGMLSWRLGKSHISFLVIGLLSLSLWGLTWMLLHYGAYWTPFLPPLVALWLAWISPRFFSR